MPKPLHFRLIREDKLKCRYSRAGLYSIQDDIQSRMRWLRGQGWISCRPLLCLFICDIATWECQVLAAFPSLGESHRASSLGRSLSTTSMCS